MTMRMFVWSDLAKMSDNYHKGGGVVAIAESAERARALVLEQKSVPGDSDVMTVNPDFSVACDSTEEQVFLFPNAGCC